jgi:hypothetical protein
MEIIRLARQSKVSDIIEGSIKARLDLNGRLDLVRRGALTASSTRTD